MKRMLVVLTLAMLAVSQTFGQVTGYSNAVGDGSTSGSPIQIHNENDLIYLSNTQGDWGKHFKQMANISFNTDETQVDWDNSGSPDGDGTTGFNPIGKSLPNSFTGSYDGQGHTIENLYISRSNTSDQALFGQTSGAEISNLGVTNCDVLGFNYVGGLLGHSDRYSTITNSYSTVSGSSNVGGLLGHIDRYSTITNSYSTVSGSSNVGGLLGRTYRGSITNSYSTGSVSGTSDHVGGLLGSQNSTGNSTSCFWDTQTSGQSGSAGGTGKSTAEMKTLATFTDETTVGLTTAWDFVSNPNDDAANNDYWDMGSINNGYPYLSWQDVDDNSLPVTLASFTGKSTKAGVLLEWETSAEIENSGFVISRSEEELPLTPSERGNSRLPLSEGAGGSFLLASYLSDNSLVGAGSVTKSTKYTFTDSKVEPGKSYTYILSDVDFSGKETELAEAKLKVEAEGAIIADAYTLQPVYPNPFNASFTVPFSLNKQMSVTIALYNIAGEKVMSILNNELSAGEYHFAVNADDLGSGVYFLKTSLSVSEQSKNHTQKLVLIK